MLPISFNNSGSALIIVLVTGVLALILSYSMSLLLTQQTRSTKRTELHGERLDLKNFVTMTLECAATKANVPSGATVNTPLGLYDGQSRLFAKSDGSTQIGSYFLKGTLTANGFLDVVVRERKSQTWQSLFPRIGTGCKIF